MSADSLYAFYDLEVSPLTFDVVTFLFRAEMARRQSGKVSLRMVVVPGVSRRFGRNDHLPEAQLDWRLRNVVVAATGLVPEIDGVHLCADRNEARILLTAARAVFPDGYTVETPVPAYHQSAVYVSRYLGEALPDLRPSAQALDHIRDWCRSHVGDRKLVAVTLREYGFHESRNSDLEAWREFLEGLDRDVYMPVALRDLETVFESTSSLFDDVPEFPMGVANLELRAALYEAAYVNLFTNSGPPILAVCNPRTRYAIFNVVHRDETPEVCTREFARAGRSVGMQHVEATELQRVVWERESAEVIGRTFADLCRAIEKAMADPQVEKDSFGHPILPRRELDRGRDQLFDLGMRLFSGANLDQAERVMRALIDRDGGDMEARLALAEILLSDNRQDEAAALIRDMQDTVAAVQGGGR